MSIKDLMTARSRGTKKETKPYVDENVVEDGESFESPLDPKAGGSFKVVVKGEPMPAIPAGVKTADHIKKATMKNVWIAKSNAGRQLRFVMCGSDRHMLTGIKAAAATSIYQSYKEIEEHNNRVSGPGWPLNDVAIISDYVYDARPERNPEEEARRKQHRKERKEQAKKEKEAAAAAEVVVEEPAPSKKRRPPADVAQFLDISAAEASEESEEEEPEDGFEEEEEEVKQPKRRRMVIDSEEEEEENPYEDVVADVYKLIAFRAEKIDEDHKRGVRDTVPLNYIMALETAAKNVDEDKSFSIGLSAEELIEVKTIVAFIIYLLPSIAASLEVPIETLREAMGVSTPLFTHSDYKKVSPKKEDRRTAGPDGNAFHIIAKRASALNSVWDTTGDALKVLPLEFGPVVKQAVRNCKHGCSFRYSLSNADTIRVVTVFSFCFYFVPKLMEACKVPPEQLREVWDVGSPMQSQSDYGMIKTGSL